MNHIDFSHDEKLRNNNLLIKRPYFWERTLHFLPFIPWATMNSEGPQFKMLFWYISPKFNIARGKLPSQYERLVFQAPFLRGLLLFFTSGVYHFLANPILGEFGWIMVDHIGFPYWLVSYFSICQGSKWRIDSCSDLSYHLKGNQEVADLSGKPTSFMGPYFWRHHNIISYLDRYMNPTFTKEQTITSILDFTLLIFCG